MEDHASIDVLICGAGAAGLTLAIDLARRGVTFRLIDKLDRPFAGSRGKGIQPRTLEVFEDLGIIDRIAAAGGPYPPQRAYRADGSHADDQHVSVEQPTPGEPYRAPLLVPQFKTEAVMRERLAEFGAAPEYGRALAGFVQDDDAVIARVAGPQGIEPLRCRYLIGADGGRSFVRHALGLGFPGETLGICAMVADVMLDGLSRDVWHRFNEGDMRRQLSFCPLPHENLVQIQAPIPLDSEADLSVAGIQAFVDARMPGSGIVVHGVSWASAYQMNARLADGYRVGRVFLMGDAAHIHPPTGGQGLNTSVQDAYNLGWKLDAVLAGASSALLDTYEEERRPIAADMLGLSTGLLEQARQGSMRRGREVHQLDLGYPWSSLSLANPPRDGLQAGDRVPDALLVGAGGQHRRLFDLLAGPHWTLLMAGRDAVPPGLPTCGIHLHRIGEGTEFPHADEATAATFGISDGDVLLIRPDGYVGARVVATESDKLVAYLTRL